MQRTLSILLLGAMLLRAPGLGGAWIACPHHMAHAATGAASAMAGHHHHGAPARDTARPCQCIGDCSNGALVVWSPAPDAMRVAESWTVARLPVRPPQRLIALAEWYHHPPSTAPPRRITL